MNLQDKVERFLSQAEVLIFSEQEGYYFLYISFSKDRFGVFSNPNNYDNLNKYFSNRTVTLTIIELENYYRASIIDKETGDSINIDDVKFVGDSLRWFINTAPTDTVINVAVVGFSKDGQTKVMQPIRPGSKPIQIHGYSFVYKQASE